MYPLIRILIVVAVALALLVPSAMATSIPADQVDAQSIYVGNPANFEIPASVNYEKVVKATPEFKELRKMKIDKGSAQYWILVSRASEHAVRAIKNVAGDGGYDLVGEKDYLAELTPAIAAEEITDKVLTAIADEE